MKNMSKKLLSLLLATIMIIGMGITTNAATPSSNKITVPVKVEIVSLSQNYNGSAQVGTLFDGNVTISLRNNQNPTAMDFILGTGLSIQRSTDGQYITSIAGLSGIDEVYTSNYYRGYSWMIDLKAGNSVTTTGTCPSWANVPSANQWFESPLAAGNVAMNGNQFFPYSYYDNSAGFTTSVEGIYVKYVVTETSW